MRPPTNNYTTHKIAAFVDNNISLSFPNFCEIWNVNDTLRFNYQMKLEHSVVALDNEA